MHVHSCLRANSVYKCFEPPSECTAVNSWIELLINEVIFQSYRNIRSWSSCFQYREQSLDHTHNQSQHKSALWHPSYPVGEVLFQLMEDLKFLTESMWDVRTSMLLKQRLICYWRESIFVILWQSLWVNISMRHIGLHSRKHKVTLKWFNSECTYLFLHRERPSLSSFPYLYETLLPLCVEFVNSTAYSFSLYSLSVGSQWQGSPPNLPTVAKLQQLMDFPHNFLLTRMFWLK